MRIGVPNEVKEGEGRVGISPDGVRQLVADGHEVVVETAAGVGAGFSDAAYAEAGATVVADAASAWDASLIVKVKEPIESEYDFLREDMTIFTYLHLAANRPVTEQLLKSGATSIAYETVTNSDRSLPLLMPMSQIAGRMSVLMGANLLAVPNGGDGTLLAAIPGSPAAKVVVLGGGVAGTAATTLAANLGADVAVFDALPSKLSALQTVNPAKIRGLLSKPELIAEEVVNADLVIGTVLIPGAATPQLVTHDMVVEMRRGSVLIDVAIDQGGCFIDSRPTTHADPTFEVEGSIFYCVGNMPGAYPRTATFALSNATLPYVRDIAAKGWLAASQDDPGLASGLSTHAGLLVCSQVGEALDMDSVPLESVLG